MIFELQVGDQALLRTGDPYANLRWEKVRRRTLKDHTFYLQRGFVEIVHRPSPEGLVKVWQKAVE